MINFHRPWHAATNCVLRLCAASLEIGNPGPRLNTSTQRSPSSRRRSKGRARRKGKAGGDDFLRAPGELYKRILQNYERVVQRRRRPVLLGDGLNCGYVGVRRGAASRLLKGCRDFYFILKAASPLKTRRKGSRQTAKVHPQDDTKQCTHINTNPFQIHASYSYNVTTSLTETSGFPAAGDPGQRGESVKAWWQEIM